MVWSTRPRGNSRRFRARARARVRVRVPRGPYPAASAFWAAFGVPASRDQRGREWFAGRMATTLPARRRPPGEREELLRAFSPWSARSPFVREETHSREISPAQIRTRHVPVDGFFHVRVRRRPRSLKASPPGRGPRPTFRPLPAEKTPPRSLTPFNPPPTHSQLRWLRVLCDGCSWRPLQCNPAMVQWNLCLSV